MGYPNPDTRKTNSSTPRRSSGITVAAISRNNHNRRLEMAGRFEPSGGDFFGFEFTALFTIRSGRLASTRLAQATLQPSNNPNDSAGRVQLNRAKSSNASRVFPNHHAPPFGIALRAVYRHLFPFRISRQYRIRSNFDCLRFSDIRSCFEFDRVYRLTRRSDICLLDKVRRPVRFGSI